MLRFMNDMDVPLGITHPPLDATSTTFQAAVALVTGGGAAWEAAGAAGVGGAVLLVMR